MMGRVSPMSVLGSISTRGPHCYKYLRSFVTSRRSRDSGGADSKLNDQRLERMNELPFTKSDLEISA